MQFINLQKQYNQIQDRLNKNILDTLKKGDFILGKSVYDLEDSLSEYVGVKECITCASGTDALMIPLMAHDIGNGDAVFTTNFSYFATTEVISLVGAQPVFVDIDKNTFNIDPYLLEEQIIRTLNEGIVIPKAIIVVNLFGQLSDYDKLEKIAKKFNLILIEDAAQSFGATYKDRRSCSFGNVSATSFYPAKPLGCYGDGGAIFTDDTELADIFRSIRVHGQGKDKYDNVRIGLNSRLDTIQAVVLKHKLEIFENELSSRNQIAEIYSKEITNKLQKPYLNKHNKSSWAQFSLLANSEIERNNLIKFLSKNDIPTSIYYNKIFSELDIYKKLHLRKYPISKSISKRIFSIPMHPYLEENEINKIVSKLNEFYGK